MRGVKLAALEVLTLFGNYIDINNSRQHIVSNGLLLDYLGAQFDIIRDLGPQIRELSIEGNPVVEKILQTEYESQMDYLESPGQNGDHFQGTVYRQIASEKLPASVKTLDCL